MPLVPAIAQLIKAQQADPGYVRPGVAPVTIADARRLHEKDILRFTPPRQRDAVGTVEEIRIPAPASDGSTRGFAASDIAARIYRPEQGSSATSFGFMVAGGG